MHTTMLLLTLMTLVLPLAMAQDADVLVLGAGTAGLTAARHLAEKNVSFIIIEGASKIGGRLRSDTFGGRRVGFGSSLIYGTPETIKDYINKYNISGRYLDFTSVTVRTSDGTQPEAESNAALVRLTESAMEAKKLYEKIKKAERPDISLRTSLQYGKWFPKNPIDDAREVYMFDMKIMQIPELVSTLGLYDRQKFQLTGFVSPEQLGQQEMLERNANDFLETDDTRLKLNEVVDKISYTGSSVSVSTKSGKTFTGKYVIVTFSMGVLKRGSVTFEPVLPEWKLDTIYRTSMAPRTQIYVEFGSGTARFWDNTQFILHVSHRRGYYPVLANVLAGTEDTKLMFLIMGEEARRIERSDKATVKTEITNVLQMMYGANTPEPEDIYITKWFDDPLTLGSICFRPVGSYNPRFMDALTSSVGRLYFAGEAYHDALVGLVEGAQLSAEYTVMKLSDCMMDQNCHQFNPNPPQQPTCDSITHLGSMILLLVTMVINLI